MPWHEEYRKGLQPLADAVSAMGRADVLVLVGHTVNSGREVWLNPYRIESVVEVVTDRKHIPGETKILDADGYTGGFWQSIWWWLRGWSIVKVVTEEGRTVETRGTQINMISGDQGKVREPIGEVMDRIQKAYSYSWDLPDSTEPKEATNQD